MFFRDSLLWHTRRTSTKKALLKYDKKFKDKKAFLSHKFSLILWHIYTYYCGKTGCFNLFRTLKTIQKPQKLLTCLIYKTCRHFLKSATRWNSWAALIYTLITSDLLKKHTYTTQYRAVYWTVSKQTPQIEVKND